MKRFTTIARLSAVCLLLVGLVFWTRAGAQMEEQDMAMLMSLMGGGIEDVSAAQSGASESGSGGLLGALNFSASTGAGVFSSIDFPGAANTRAFGINANGDIVGSYDDPTGTRGYLLSNGSFNTIDVPGAVFTEAWGINPQGDIIGRYRNPGEHRPPLPATATHGFALTEGTFTNIDAPGHLHTLPTKMSPKGDIVGCFHDTNFLVDMRGYVQRGSRLASFEMLPSTMHNSITPGGGTIVGISFDAATVVHAYTITRGMFTQFDFPDPNVMFTQVWDVNPRGTIVGYHTAVLSRGFSLDANGFAEIHVPGARWTRVFGINPEGDVVGNYADGSGRVHGFLRRGRTAS